MEKQRKECSKHATPLRKKTENRKKSYLEYEYPLDLGIERLTTRPGENLGALVNEIISRGERIAREQYE